MFDSYAIIHHKNFSYAGALLSIATIFKFISIIMIVLGHIINVNYPNELC